MEKLQLEDIACFLPYRLFYQLKGNFPIKEGKENIINDIKELNPYVGFNLLKLIEWETMKPILREFDLTKPIIHNGVQVIPILELAKIGWYNNAAWQSIPEKGNLALSRIKSSGYDGAQYIEFTFRETHKSFSLNCLDSDFKYVGHYAPRNQLQLFKKLYEWKFDIDNLIGRGLAMSASSLNINPYDK